MECRILIDPDAGAPDANPVILLVANNKSSDTIRASLRASVRRTVSGRQTVVTTKPVNMPGLIITPGTVVFDATELVIDKGVKAADLRQGSVCLELVEEGTNVLLAEHTCAPLAGARLDAPALLSPKAGDTAVPASARLMRFAWSSTVVSERWVVRVARRTDGAFASMPVMAEWKVVDATSARYSADGAELVPGEYAWSVRPAADTAAWAPPRTFIVSQPPKTSPAGGAESTGAETGTASAASSCLGVELLLLGDTASARTLDSQGSLLTTSGNHVLRLVNKCLAACPTTKYIATWSAVNDKGDFIQGQSEENQPLFRRTWPAGLWSVSVVVSPGSCETSSTPSAAATTVRFRVE